MRSESCCSEWGPLGQQAEGQRVTEASWGLSRGLKQWVLWEDSEPNLNGNL